jgi:hypothetical protein
MEKEIINEKRCQAIAIMCLFLTMVLISPFTLFYIMLKIKDKVMVKL